MNETPIHTTENHTSNDRLPRWQFRKQRKLAARREQRQRDACVRDEKNRPQEDKDLKAHSLYLQQKRQWEDREKRYNMINLAKKRAEELERAAKEAAKKEWQEALLRIPMLPPNMRGSNQHPTRHIPKFVSSSSSPASKQDPDTYETSNWP